MPQVTVH